MRRKKTKTKGHVEDSDAGAERAQEPPAGVAHLVERFRSNEDSYRSEAYKEAEVRSEFIDPFFKALGWDVYNEKGHAEAYKDLIREDAIKVGGATKAPDYCFRIGGTRKFFVEAKKPARDVAEDARLAFQLRRYAWSAKLPLSILTDFEELAVYDCRFRPVQTDSATKARTLYLRYGEYLTRWEELSSIFSQGAVLKGSFDKYAESTRRKRGTAEVDQAFLKDIEGWRVLLARNIALRNAQLSRRELNFAVARTIDRIIFLRMCEDRGIEDYGRLMALRNGTDIHQRLCELFRRADERYNSGLFHFRQERGRPEPPDELTPNLTIDDDVLKGIFRGLYYPDSPYEFSVLPADILGQVYEQFLGKVIRLTAAHRAVVEDKPEVKKAGGVYYTPTYIVEYIVKNTVGKLLEGKIPRQVAGMGRNARPLRVLDPACGSGSFLIGAYQYLLDWHRDWYVEHVVPLLQSRKTAGSPEVRKLLPQVPARKGRGSRRRRAGSPLPVYEGRGGEWRLTTAERKRILLNSIYGVDIDPQAVEVTKLSLLLKVLEGENSETLETQRKLWHERALPDLASNIKCGNSLIGPDFYDTGQTMLFGEDERYRVNVFDWKAEFPEVFQDKNPGFDAVIGNPPYVLLQSLKEPAVFDYLASSYEAATYKIDTYQVFIEKAIRVVSRGGRAGYITPSSFLRNKHAVQLRDLILRKSNVRTLRVFYYPVFAGSSVDTSIIVAERSDNPSPAGSIEVMRSHGLLGPHERDCVIQEVWVRHPHKEFGLPGPLGSETLVNRIRTHSRKLGEFATAYFGIQTYERRRYVSPSRQGPHFKPTIDGSNVTRYNLSPSSEYVDFRPQAIKSGGKAEVYGQERIGVRQIGESPIATLIPAGIYTLNTVYNVFLTKPTDYKPKFLLGVLCSKLIAWYWRRCFFDQKRTFPKIKKEPLLSIPVPRIEFSETRDKWRHDHMVELVERMLALNKDLAAAKTPHDKKVFQRQIDATDRQIDRLVYELYGLTEAEIKTVEEG